MTVSLKLTLVLCACFFTFGTTWADWSVDYWLIWTDPALNPNAISNAITYYQSLHNTPLIHKFVPLVPVLICVVGLSLGFAEMFDINFLFDGGSLALLLLALQVYATTITPGMRIVATSEDETEVVRKLYEIATGHTLIVLAAAGSIWLLFC
ncbi:ER membrane protein SH3 [Endogone sp. FLAS-F59071]|nr:ER membrane protein SH3 [Endogone sp. FLAS-F59071]|eukprot:RUS22468.1 ER membrane protein SH3 [Endogone sp. FLAS-F59071]